MFAFSCYATLERMLKSLSIHMTYVFADIELPQIRQGRQRCHRILHWQPLAKPLMSQKMRFSVVSPLYNTANIPLLSSVSIVKQNLRHKYRLFHAESGDAYAKSLSKFGNRVLMVSCLRSASTASCKYPADEPTNGIQRHQPVQVALLSGGKSYSSSSPLTKYPFRGPDVLCHTIRNLNK